ncbi:MAG TPA: prepilin-type N-terminal cleavage/methylation domain-containing protein [Verrucomicrobiae bacterium]|jgi:prepilin-type N-terminal cleavage/methylation domain-containing protein/prepilin-type processing-associated H-X9-DG protein|nr:prepilin-type N-terminal cleavage/methylation domain-containing protein [Verrucomicrobiae bacterium]
MKSLWHKQENRAFTLIEMLVVIAIIAVLAALLLPALTQGKRRAQRIQCIGNLKEMGTAFQIFAHDHRGKFPMQTPVADGGSQEFVMAGLNINGTFYFSYRHLQTLAGELVVPRLLICPADLTREPALSFNSLQNSNVSYFVNAYADYDQSLTTLAGDRNITNAASATASLVRGTYGLRWTRELHSFKGNVLFSDTHVEQLNNVQVSLPGATVANSVFFLPAVRIPTSAGAITLSVGGSPGSTVSQSGTPPRPPGARPPASAGPDTPTPAPPPAPARNGMSGSTMAAHAITMPPTIIVANARETNAVAENSDPQSAAAPAAIDEDQPPLLWLQGAAHTVIAKSSWWLWLLLALLIAAAAYLYSRKKSRGRARRRS